MALPEPWNTVVAGVLGAITVGVTVFLNRIMAKQQAPAAAVVQPGPDLTAILGRFENIAGNITGQLVVLQDVMRGVGPLGERVAVAEDRIQEIREVTDSTAHKVDGLTTKMDQTLDQARQAKHEARNAKMTSEIVAKHIGLLPQSSGTEPEDG